MDPLFLDYYNRELVYMREMAAEFGAQHPKIAHRLGMHGTEVADPYVERLVESFAFMAARTQIKLDAEFPRFAQRLLEVIYPNYICPTPSMSVARLWPSPDEGDLSKGVAVPRHSAFKSKVPMGEHTACEFRSAQEVVLWPMDIVRARLTGLPPDIARLERLLPPGANPRGALRLTLKLSGGMSFSALRGLDRLPVYLCGEEALASHLFELLHTSSIATVMPMPQDGAAPYLVARDAVAHEGLEPDQGLLPLQWNTLHANNLLHEYFTCPSRFYFFSLTQLAAGLARVDADEVELVVLLSQDPGELASRVDASQFALYCTPVINLFPRHTDRVQMDTASAEFHLVPDRARPLDFEIYSVSEMQGLGKDVGAPLSFRPLYQTLSRDGRDFGRYFTLRRERRLLSAAARRDGSRTPYVGTEVFVSLVDQHDAPYSDKISYLSAHALMSNRDLAAIVPRNGRSDLTAVDALPVLGVGLIRPLSTPRPPFAEREHAWRLIRQLGFNYLPLTELRGRDGGQALRDLLALFVSADDTAQARQLDSLVGSDLAPVTRRLPGAGPLVYGRGVACRLTVDERGFSGGSPYLFGLMLERWLARHVSINVFTQTELHSVQRGMLHRWAPRMGARGVV